MRDKGDWGVVFDCDGTLFPREIQSLMKLVDDHVLSAEAKQQTAKLRDFYLPLALSGTLTSEQERDWLIETIRIYANMRISENQLRDALHDARLRPGTADGLHELHASGVKLGVISCGVHPLIRVALELNGVSHLFKTIYAATMDMDSLGRFTNYHNNSFVIPKNKGEWSRLFAQVHGISDERLLAVGDSGGDRYLGILQKNRLGVIEKPEDASKLTEFTGGVVLVNDSFTPAINWLLQKINS